MVNWQDPVLLLRDYCALPNRRVDSNVALTNYLLLVDLTKLLHATAGLYM